MNEKITSSVHPDCEYYRHKEYANRYCCGGSKITERVEMIFCNGKVISCKNCKDCRKFKSKIRT